MPTPIGRYQAVWPTTDSRMPLRRASLHQLYNVASLIPSFWANWLIDGLCSSIIFYSTVSFRSAEYRLHEPLASSYKRFQFIRQPPKHWRKFRQSVTFVLSFQGEPEYFNFQQRKRSNGHSLYTIIGQNYTTYKYWQIYLPFHNHYYLFNFLLLNAKVYIIELNEGQNHLPENVI